MFTVCAGDKSCRVNSMRQAMPFLMDYLRPFLRGYHTPEDGRIALHDAMTRVRITDDQGTVYTTNNSLTLRKAA